MGICSPPMTTDPMPPKASFYSQTNYPIPNDLLPWSPKGEACRTGKKKTMNLHSISPHKRQPPSSQKPNSFPRYTLTQIRDSNHLYPKSPPTFSLADPYPMRLNTLPKSPPNWRMDSLGTFPSASLSSSE